MKKPKDHANGRRTVRAPRPSAARPATHRQAVGSARRPAAASPQRRRGRNETPQTGSPFPVVGIGASAGGLEAFSQLLTHLPATTGMAFVVVQHLDPTHESSLVDLLSRATTMRVWR
jgi:chemotaxis response regulator CheB